VHTTYEDKSGDVKDSFYEVQLETRVYMIFSNDTGVRVVNFATSKNLVVRSTVFPHLNIHKYTWAVSEGEMHNQSDHVL
jgi:hypothetical protein